MNHKYGHFNADGSEFVITDPRTPRAFDNFIWNETAFSNVQQTGVGYFDYQIGETEAVQLFTGVGRICDFDVFGRDHLMSRLIYIRDNETGEFWNLNWEPVRKAYDSFECTHGLGYSIIRSKVNGVTAELRIFIPKGTDPVELWSLKVETDKPRNLSLFAYSQFQFKYKSGFDSYGDMIFRGSWFNKEQNAVVASKHPFRKPHNFLIGFVTADRNIDAFDGSREAFVGTYSTLADPQALINGKCSNTPGCSDATICAAQFDIKTTGSGAEEISLIIGATDDEANIGAFKTKYFGKIEAAFNELKEEKKALTNLNKVSTPDVQFDRLVNSWVKQATLFGATWCRWGWFGYRDIVQHGLGVSAMQPERTKAILKKAFAHQYSTGLALRGWNPVDEKAYSDSALWLVFTLVSYLKETGDVAFLDEQAPFYDGGSGTVLEHIDRALDFLEKNKGAHQLLLIKFGDWNDSLTGVGKEGRGESIWLSQAYAEAVREMAALMAHLGNTGKEQNYLSRRKAIIDAINEQGWDGKWYTRCYDDSGRAIGSHTNEFAKIFMEPQSWGLISGAASEERAKRVVQSCDEELPSEVGYLLLSPTFTRFDEGIGRISSLEPGVCENGTVYSHLNIWMILGLLRYGMADKAYEVFKKISPGYVSGEGDLKQKCPPYIYSNCYFGPAHRNNKYQMEFTWITGSVAWYNTVLLNEMVGIKPTYAGIEVDPCIPSSWDNVEVERTFRGATYRFKIRNPRGLQKGSVKLTLDGKAIEGSTLPLDTKGGTHDVEVVIEESAGKPAAERELAGSAA